MGTMLDRGLRRRMCRATPRRRGVVTWAELRQTGSRFAKGRDRRAPSRRAHSSSSPGLWQGYDGLRNCLRIPYWRLDGELGRVERQRACYRLDY